MDSGTRNLGERVRREEHKLETQGSGDDLSHGGTAIQRRQQGARQNLGRAGPYETEDVVAGRARGATESNRKTLRHGFVTIHCVIGIIGRQT